MPVTYVNEVIMGTRPTTDKFPLWHHVRGGFAEKISQQVYYFGQDRDAALREYLRV